METKTLKEIQTTIRSARDSVWVIDDTLEKLAEGRSPSKEYKGNLERNVGHLNIVVADQDVIDSGEDIADLQSAILNGQTKLDEDIWTVV